MSYHDDQFAASFDVSRETLDRLRTYALLLEQWNSRINLVSPSTISTLWTRHFQDSAQLLNIAPTTSSWADLGSGGGFPGLVVAILKAEHNDEAKVTLIESDQRKATFLKTVIRETGIDAKVLSKRIESVEPLMANIVSARALAPLTDLLGYAERHLAKDGRALFMKGNKADQEISSALESWRFHCEKHQSITDVNATILNIGDITRV